ncbi:MAG: hydrogenase expression/formation protein HypE [Nitrospiraceae bacterium]|nr:hydrogenase expression/formation protein HypE [Nitrospiraceae bacterium]
MEKILLGHGSGGRIMHTLIRERLAPVFGMETLNDSAVLDICSKGRIAFTTDSYVVSPIFFPGGDIGDLAVFGTVNDLAVSGADPLYISVGFIIEEGFSMDSFERILASMAAAAKRAGVKIVTGDTKVVDKGKGDGIFINTSGIGIVKDGISLGPDKIKPGDQVIVSGAIGRHGISVMAERNGLSFDPPVLSDTAPLNGLVDIMLNVCKDIKMMRDPTRGGVATTLKEMAFESGLCIQIEENMLPVTGGVRGACELLGLDPLYVANEGILLAIVPAESVESLLAAMRDNETGKGAVRIGAVVDPESINKTSGSSAAGTVLLRTAIGGSRVIDMLAGEQLPRIC